MDMATEPSKDESLGTPPKNQTGPKVSDQFAWLLVYFSSMLVTDFVCCYEPDERKLDPIIPLLLFVEALEPLKCFLAMYLATGPPKEYKLMGRKMRCATDILPVGFAMALGFIYPNHMECVFVLTCWTVQCYIFGIWWGVHNIISAWNILVTMPVQLFSFWFVATKIANTDHPLVFSAMALGLWAAISIYRTCCSSPRRVPLICEEYAVLPDH
ncbi:hypothetical protein DM860_010804 [Cuscuta australis]|uniref:Uncharacterized protein n=1 Tax=Cuscuta australis TaxID=267555 RepID=A0A328DZZ7_9ASTE|nr:hypothetical protein DM860_010804 [Cuscuta australis]